MVRGRCLAVRMAMRPEAHPVLELVTEAEEATTAEAEAEAPWQAVRSTPRVATLMSHLAQSQLLLPLLLLQQPQQRRPAVLEVPLKVVEAWA